LALKSGMTLETNFEEERRLEEGRRRRITHHVREGEERKSEGREKKERQHAGLSLHQSRRLLWCNWWIRDISWLDRQSRHVRWHDSVMLEQLAGLASMWRHIIDWDASAHAPCQCIWCDFFMSHANQSDVTKES
jgi:hypothetical protein